MKRLKCPEIVNPLISRVSKDISSSVPENLKEIFPGEGDFLTRKGVEEKIEEFENREGVIAQTALTENKIKCPSCGQINWGLPRKFNMMFKTSVGSVQGDDMTVSLRPETAQGMFVNFKNIIDSFHPKLPFGIAQIGRSFRNEIAPRDFIFRVRELEQMEVEDFTHPDQWQDFFEEWRGVMHERIKGL